MKFNINNIDRVIFCSDFMRINEGNIWDDRSIIANIDMIHNLFAPLISGVFKEIRKIVKFCVNYGNENGRTSLRFSTYHALGLPMETESWAYIFGNEETKDIIHSQMENVYTQKDFVICYETPPYMVWYFNKYNIPFIDIRIHAVRFLKDYMFSFYSNVEEIQKKIKNLCIDDTFIYRHVSISMARTARIFRSRPDVKGNVLFLGQTTCDSSLIQNNHISTLPDILESLLQLSVEYEIIYYKKHPYQKDTTILEKICKSTKNLKMADHNIYDLFVLPFDKIVSMSSGANIEAKYFGVEAEWILKENWLPYIGTKSDWQTTPVYKYPFTYEFWKYLLSNNMIFEIPDNIDYADQAVKFVLNMKWGR